MDRAKDVVFLQQNKVMPEKPETSLGGELTRQHISCCHVLTKFPMMKP